MRCAVFKAINDPDLDDDVNIPAANMSGSGGHGAQQPGDDDDDDFGVF